MTSSGSPLPPGWRWVRLGDVCVRRTGVRDPRTEPDTPFLYVDISSVDNVAKRITLARTILGKEAPSRARKVIREGDVIVSTTRPNLNAVAVVPAELDNSVCSTGFCVLRPGPDVFGPLLFAWAQSEPFILGLSDLVVGALYPAVTDAQVMAQPLPLPPLREQRRIAAILSEQMAAVDRARAAAEERLAAVKALPAAYLRQVFPAPGQPLPEGWRWVRLGEICAIDSAQVDPTDQRYRGLPHVSAESIESGTGRLLDVRSAADDGMISGKYLFDAGVILYSKLRPYLSKAAVAPFRGVCSADIYPVTPNAQCLAAPFLLHLFLSEPFTAYAVRESRRARMPKINRDQLFAYTAPLPPLIEQRRIAAILSEQMAAVDRARAAAEAELQAVNALPAALLRRAFSGGL